MKRHLSIAASILPEFEIEMANTRKVLDCIPDDKLDWQAHDSASTARASRKASRSATQNQSRLPSLKCRIRFSDVYR